MEYEMAAIFGGMGNTEGKSLGTGDVEENVFGLVIMNDWSARYGPHSLTCLPSRCSYLALTSYPHRITPGTTRVTRCSL
jgi:hypothetical protein